MEGIVSEVIVGLRQLKSRLSQYLRQVKAGQTVVITDPDKPVARIIQAGRPLEERLQAMTEAGLLLWSGNKLEPMAPVARVRGARTVADLLVEDRQ
jgi:prevent-host-death family protein